VACRVSLVLNINRIAMMESSSITTNNLGSTTTPSIKKSLRELSRASSTLGLNTEYSTSSNNHHPLLTQRGIDTAKLQRNVHELEFHHATPSSTGNTAKKQRRFTRPLPNTASLTQYLNYTRDVQLEGILEKQMEKVKRRTEERVQSRLLDDWTQMKQKMVNSVIGGRGLGGVLSISSHGNNDPRMGLGVAPTCPTYMDESGNLPPFARKHLDFLLLSSNNHDRGGAIKLGKLAELLKGQHKSNSTTKGYYNATHLLESMLSSSSKNTVETRAMGALDFLAAEFKLYVITTVKNSGGGREGIGASFAGYIKALVEMEIGRERVQMDFVWRCLYYCLRCGDANAGVEVVKSCKEMPPTILQILQHMAQNQRDRRNIFESSSRDTLTNTAPSLCQLCQHVVDLHHRASSTNRGNVGVDGYELACLAMLSLSNLSTDNTSQQVATNIEDYMYMALWNAVHSDEKDETSSSSCSGVIATLGEDVQRWGPAHFDDEGGANVWAYALPLFLCQQFHSGLIHLTNLAGGEGLCMAVHLGLGMRSVGSMIDDWRNGRDDQREAQDGDLLTKLLVTYSSSLQGASPEAALAYLIQIPEGGKGGWKTDVWMKNGQQLGNIALKQISVLLLTTNALQSLVGSLSPNGSRNSIGAAMDHHLTSDGVSKVLATAADQAIRQGNLSNAAELLSLGGHYSTLLALLNQELSSLLVVGGEGGELKDKRIFWRDAALRFHATYLLNGQTHVIQVLEKENKLPLGNAFELLLNLMAFFDLCSESKWENAWALIDGLVLFPATESEIAHKVESFNSLNTGIQQQFHHVITNAMECLYQQHESLKANLGSEVMSPSVTAIQQRLNEVRTRGRLLVTFAGLVPFMNFSDEAKARIARMEAFMI